MAFGFCSISNWNRIKVKIAAKTDDSHEEESFKNTSSTLRSWDIPRRDLLIIISKINRQNHLYHHLSYAKKMDLSNPIICLCWAWGERSRPSQRNSRRIPSGGNSALSRRGPGPVERTPPPDGAPSDPCAGMCGTHVVMNINSIYTYMFVCVCVYVCMYYIIYMIYVYVLYLILYTYIYIYT